MIYIASPFTSDNVFLEAERHDAVRLYTAGCIERGEVAYSPIVHGVSICHAKEIDGGFNTWRDHCLGMLAKADELRVLKLEGYDESQGVNAEIAFALDNGVPVTYVTP